MTEPTPRMVIPNFKQEPGEGKPWNCRRDDATCTRTKPCNSCRGARSRRSGMRKQREARKALERLTGADAAKFLGQLGNEESWSGLPFRVEVKSGMAAQVVATKYVASRDQSDATKAIGDARPFLALFMPPGWGEGHCLVVIEIQQ